MAFIIPTTWSATTAYTVGQQVILDGVLYEATGSITAGTNPKTSTLWTVFAVHQIQDYNSLVEKIRLTINVVGNDNINRSIPVYIQLAEESFKTRIRVPQMRRRVVLTSDSQSRLIIPADLLEFINLRQNSDTAPGIDIRSRGVVEIHITDNYEFYSRVRLGSVANDFVDFNDENAFDAPVAFYDSTYLWIAPEYPTNTEFELWYYANIPMLGSTVMLTDADGNPVDANGARTSISGLPQATQMVERNWYTAAAPQMIYYGSLLKAAEDLNNEPRAEKWMEQFELAQAETQDMIDNMTVRTNHPLFIENSYSSQI